MCSRNVASVGILIVLLTRKVNCKYCSGGHYCTPPKECCSLGCCYLYPPQGPAPPSTTNLISFFVWNHWFVWFLILLIVLSCLGGCSIYRRRLFPPLTSSTYCCCCFQLQRHDDDLSELDSVGSCYPPPHYSRCSSFHRAPPPYTEVVQGHPQGQTSKSHLHLAKFVQKKGIKQINDGEFYPQPKCQVTTKPDLYPLVISYNEENNKYTRNYLMVQYFRNFILRPSLGTLPNTNTTDSINSNILCRSDSGVPPSYEEQATCRMREEIELQTIITIPSISSNNAALQRDKSMTQGHTNDRRASYNVLAREETEDELGEVLDNTNRRHLLRTSDHHYEEPITRDNLVNYLSTSTDSVNNNRSTKHQLHYYSTDIVSGVSYYNSTGDSISLDSPPRGSIQDFVSSDGLSHPSNHFSTSSDISSLQGCGTPSSPPQATSPTVELRDILDKIQKLPTDRSVIEDIDSDRLPARPDNLNIVRNVPVRSKTFYVSTGNNKKSKIHFASHSEPVTPSTNIYSPTSLANLFHLDKFKGSKKKLNKTEDLSPLLAEDDDNNKADEVF